MAFVSPRLPAVEIGFVIITEPALRLDLHRKRLAASDIDLDALFEIQGAAADYQKINNKNERKTSHFHFTLFTAVRTSLTITRLPNSVKPIS